MNGEKVAQSTQRAQRRKQILLSLRALRDLVMYVCISKLLVNFLPLAQTFNQTLMPLLVVGIGIILLLLLISKFKINAFMALLVTSFAVGLLSNMNLLDILDSILKGIGDTMGKVLLILAFGAMLGKILEESGAAHTISFKMIDWMGVKNIQYALLITGFLVGLPMMYNASFLVLVPLIYTFAKITKMPLIWLALPLCSALSVAHCFLPPHPAPTYVSFIYGANINMVLLYGLIPMVPACLIGGVWLSRFTKGVKAEMPADLFQVKDFEKHDLPGLGISILCAVTPIILMLFGAVTDIVFGPPPVKAELTRLGIEYLRFLPPAFCRQGLQRTIVRSVRRTAYLFQIYQRCQHGAVHRCGGCPLHPWTAQRAVHGRCHEQCSQVGRGCLDDCADHRRGWGLFAGIEGWSGDRIHPVRLLLHPDESANYGLPDRIDLSPGGGIGHGFHPYNRPDYAAYHAANRHLPRVDGACYRSRQCDVVALQRLRVLDVQGVFRTEHQTNLSNLDGDGIDHRGGGDPDGLGNGVAIVAALSPTGETSAYALPSIDLNALTGKI